MSNTSRNTHPVLSVLSLPIILLVTACTVVIHPQADSSESTSAGMGSSSSSSSGGSSGATSSTSIASSSSSDTSGSADETGAGSHECDVFMQDCEEGEKCMPFGSNWSSTRCASIDDDPDGFGDPCMVDGDPMSGLDSCDAGLMCYHVDPKTLQGTCISICTGSEADPMCDPQGTCTMLGRLAICEIECDPLLQDCPNDPSLGCYPGGPMGTWECSLNRSEGGGITADPCGEDDGCEPGHVCLPQIVVPGCQGAEKCCAWLCDLTEDPIAECAMAGSRTCVEWYSPPEAAPPGYEDVGVCAMPFP